MIDPINQLTPDEVNQIKDLYDRISKSDDAKNHKLLTVNTTIFAIVVTLTSFDTTNKLLLCLYITTLVLFVLSIISGYLFTNMSGHLYRKSLNKYLEHLAEVKTDGKNDTELVVKASWYYEVSSYVSEIGTYLALFSLAAFTLAKQLS